MPSIRLAFALCLFSLFIVAPVQAQDEPVKALSLNDVKTVDDAFAYLKHEGDKDGPSLVSLTPKERAVKIAGILMPVGNKILEIAKTHDEKGRGYRMKFNALQYLVQAESEGAEQKVETFLKELAAQKEFEYVAEFFQCEFLEQQTKTTGIEATEQKWEAFLKEVDAKEKMRLVRNYSIMVDFSCLVKKRKKQKPRLKISSNSRPH